MGMSSQLSSMNQHRPELKSGELGHTCFSASGFKFKTHPRSTHVPVLGRDNANQFCPATDASISYLLS